MWTYILVGIGSFFGGILRYSITEFPIKENFVFPINTLLINLIGSLIIGLIFVYISDYNINNLNANLFLKVGFCGGFTTFSTFTQESFQLFESGSILLAVLYISLSVICGILLFIFPSILLNNTVY